MADVAVSSLVLFITSLIVAAAVAGLFATEVGGLAEDIDHLGADSAEKVGADIEIVNDEDSPYYGVDGGDDIRLYVKNTGVRELPTDPEQLEVFLDGEFVDAANLSVTVLDGSAWEPGRVIELRISAACITAGDHRSRVGVDGDRETVEFTTPAGTGCGPWGYRKAITIQSSEVSADLTDFPVLIDLTDADLADHAQGDGDDIKFTDASGNQLDHEIERFDGGTGDLEAWVRIPSLSSSSDTTIYMYYGNPSAANQENVTDVWSNGYEMVQHLEESSGTPTDSTANGNDGTNNGATQGVAGIIDGAIAVDGSGDYVQVPETVNDGEFTVQLWFESPGSSWSGTLFDATYGGTKYFHISATDSDLDGCFESADDSDVTLDGDPSLGGGSWHQVAMTGEFSSSGPHVLYLDGSSVDSSSTTVDGKSNLDSPRLGYYTETYDGGCGTKADFDGDIDEFRIVNRKLSAAWIETEYNNVNDPSSFYTVGSEEAL